MPVFFPVFGSMKSMARDEALPLHAFGNRTGPESLIKIWLGHSKKGVTEQSYIKMMGRMDTRRKCVESVGLGFTHVPKLRLATAAYTSGNGDDPR
jgi:hypothetical protein